MAVEYKEHLYLLCFPGPLRENCSKILARQFGPDEEVPASVLFENTLDLSLK